MESNRILDNVFDAVDNISDSDLDALLEIESSPAKQSATDNVAEQFVKKSSLKPLNLEILPSQLQIKNNHIVQNDADNVAEKEENNPLIVLNHQMLPSQLDLESQRTVRSGLPFDLSAQVSEFNLSLLSRDSSSLIIATPEIEHILINDSEVTEKDIENKAKETKSSTVLSPNTHSHNERSIESLKFPTITKPLKNELLNLSSIPDNTDTTFEREFAKYESVFVEFPPLDVDFEELDTLERDHVVGSDEHSSKAYKTQIPYTEKEVIVPPNLNTTCPPRIALSPLSPTRLSSIANNALDYLELNYSKCTSQASQSDYNQMRISNVLQDTTISNAPVNEQLNAATREQLPMDVEVTAADDAPPTPTLHGTNSNEAESNIINIAPELSLRDNEAITFGRTHNATADGTMIPTTVKELYDIIKSKYSEFAFVYALSAQLCQDRVPMDCFVSLKMGLLLSLASLGTHPDRTPIPVVAIGNDSYMANYLLRHVGQLAARFMGPVEDVKIPAANAAYRQYKWIEADPVLLAKGGVFYVGDFSHLKAARADQLFKYIECSRVPIANSAHVYTLETAIWAHWRSFKYNSKDQQTFNKLVKIFGIPLFMDDDNHEVLVNYILEQSSLRIFESTIDHLSISDEDMRTFLAVISKRTVDFSEEASELLQKYFVASRVARPDCLTKQAFVILKQFAESFAKLSFRHDVLTIDAVAAIYMCEHFIQNVFGVGDNPPPRFQSHKFIGLVDEHLAEFQKWLFSYIKIYYNKTK